MDIERFRDDKLAEEVRNSQRKRFKSVYLVDLIIVLDKEWRRMRHNLDTLRRDLGLLQKQIGEKKKAGEQCDDLVAKKVVLEKEIKREERTEQEARQILDAKLFQVGNLVHESVPVSDNEDNNGLVRQWGEKRPHTEDLLHHHELLYMIDGYEPRPGGEVAGHRGYFLKGPGVLLNQALINYGLAFLAKRDYTTLQTPYFMNRDVMAKTAQLSDFDEQLYKVTGSEGEEKYLIATSEQPISAFHQNEWIQGDHLPKKYAGYSTNFRKEAGGHGRDVWGIFRVHQFEKIEQFVICAPEKSWEMHETMVKASEEFLQSLGIAYHVVNIVSGELNDAASKKYDVEGWFPALNAYRELVSCSNCTDFQSRRLNITTGGPQDKKFVHMLNSTLCATSRAVCAILETYQTDKGVKVPEVLIPYVGKDFIPFVREVPKEMKVKKDAPAPAAAKGEQKKTEKAAKK